MRKTVPVQVDWGCGSPGNTAELSGNCVLVFRHARIPPPAAVLEPNISAPVPTVSRPCGGLFGVRQNVAGRLWRGASRRTARHRRTAGCRDSGAIQQGFCAVPFPAADRTSSICPWCPVRALVALPAVPRSRGPAAPGAFGFRWRYLTKIARQVAGAG